MCGYDAQDRYFTDPNSDFYHDDYPLGDSAKPVVGDFTYRGVECDWWNHEKGELPYEAYCTLNGVYLYGEGVTLADAKTRLRVAIDAHLNKEEE